MEQAFRIFLIGKQLRPDQRDTLCRKIDAYMKGRRVPVVTTAFDPARPVGRIVDVHTLPSAVVVSVELVEPLPYDAPFDLGFASVREGENARILEASVVARDPASQDYSALL